MIAGGHQQAEAAEGPDSICPYYAIAAAILIVGLVAFGGLVNNLLVFGR